MHAYKFTHFSAHGNKTTNPEEISLIEKTTILFTGVNNPRPKNDKFPSQKFHKITLNDRYQTSCWYIKKENAKGIILLFHGYGGNKSDLIRQSNEFLKLNYSTVLVDFMGSGDSDGDVTTIGYFESDQVKNIFNYFQSKGEKNIIPYGSSMGAVSIMRAISFHQIQPTKIIIECPFGSLLKTVQSRFSMMGLPSFPMANLIVFWGGFQNGFNGFSHNPIDYAKNINCPVLLMHGADDPKVSKNEIESIYYNIRTRKKLVYFKNTGHENYLNKNKKKWKQEIKLFLDE